MLSEVRAWWRSLLLRLRTHQALAGGICSGIEHQQDQLMYQQTVIDEAGAARTPVPQHAQEYRGKLVDLRIGNKPETLAVDEKLYAQLVDVEANPLGEVVLAWNERCSKETSEAACVHVDDAHEKSSNPDDHETERSSEWTRDLETISGRVGAGEQTSISSDADAIAAVSSHGKQRSSLGGVGTSCTAVRGAEFGHALGHTQSSNTGTQPTEFRVVQICQTERDEAAGE